MNIVRLIIPVSALWLLSEIALAIVKRAQAKSADNLDKRSLRILWITIIASIFVGVMLGTRGIGLLHLGGYWIIYLGLMLIVVGLIIRWIAILTLGRYFTVNVNIAKDQQIVDSGIYKFIRHPSYTGSLLSFLGLGLSFSNWLSALIIFIPITIAFIYRIGIEEKALAVALATHTEITPDRPSACSPAFINHVIWR